MPIPFKSFLRKHSALYKLAHSRLRDGLHRLTSPSVDPYPQYARDSGDWLLTKAIIEKFARDIRNDGRDFLLVAIPNTVFVYGGEVADTPQRLLAEMAEAADIPFLDLLPAMRRASKAQEERVYFLEDAHWTPLGHEVAAQAIAEAIEREFGVPRTR